ncbi:MAG: hypothetical protein ACKVOP_07400 [Sphingomonadaceae bacterium]
MRAGYSNGACMAVAGWTMADVARDPAFVRAHERLVADRSTQFDMPRFEPPELPEWLKPVFEAIADVIAFIAPAFPYLFWGAVVLIVGMIAWLVISEMRGVPWRWPWQRKAAVASTEDWAPDAAQARVRLAEADALAADGRFAEAARLLLRRSVEDIGERRPEFLKPSLTARDIAAADAVPSVARQAFSAIARVVEVSTFGSAAVSADAWAACRARYGEFALAGSWRG